jgi:NitT/TauT family transport system substrate-binding protein
MKKTIAAATALFLAMTAAVGAEAPVRTAYLQSDIHHLAFWVALEKGFYKEAGVDVEVAGVFKAGPEIMTAFSAGELDMAYVGEAPATTAVANRSADVAVVAQVNTEGSALVVARKDLGMKGLSGLKGKTVAVPGHSTVQDFLLRRALDENGVSVSRDAVHIIVLKPPEMIGALRTGQIDAFIAWEPYPSKAATMEVGGNLAASKELWPGHPCCALVADRKFMKARPDTVKAMVAAHVRATHYIQAHPDEAAAIGVQYTGMDLDTVRSAMNNVHYTPVLSIEGEKEYVRFLSELGYIRLDDPDAFVDGFLEDRILREVLRP